MANGSCDNVIGHDLGPVAEVKLLILNLIRVEKYQGFKIEGSGCWRFTIKYT